MDALQPNISISEEDFTILNYLKQIKDYRRAEGQRYKLHYVLLFSIFALMSGARTYRSIEIYINAHLGSLIRYFNIEWKRSPDYTQIRNIFIGLDDASVEAAACAYAKYLSELKKMEYQQNLPSNGLAPNEVVDILTGEVKGLIAFDGKVLRGSINHSRSKKALQKLMAFCLNTELILGHVDLEHKKSEITAARRFFEELNLSGEVFTLDALHCQKKLWLQPKLVATI